MNGLGILLPFRACGAKDAVRLGLEAERLGYSSVWTPEVSTFDAISVAAALAATTEQISVGTAIVPLDSRTPVSLAMSAASLSDLAPGRVTLGIGVSTRTIMEQWHGRDFGRPLSRAKDTLAIINEVLEGNRTNLAGVVHSSVGFRLDVVPSERPKVFLAALGEGMRKLALEDADGMILNFLPRSKAQGLLQNQSPSKPFVIACFVRVAVADARGASETRIRKEMASYLRIEQYRNWIASFGFGGLSYAPDEDLSSVARRLPSEFVEDVAILGNAEECREKLSKLAELGIVPIVVPAIAAGDLESYRGLMNVLAR